VLITPVPGTDRETLLQKLVEVKTQLGNLRSSSPSVRTDSIDTSRGWLTRCGSSADRLARMI
jgi:hypothetical protein